MNENSMVCAIMLGLIAFATIGVSAVASVEKHKDEQVKPIEVEFAVPINNFGQGAAKIYSGDVPAWIGNHPHLKITHLVYCGADVVILFEEIKRATKTS